MCIRYSNLHSYACVSFRCHHNASLSIYFRCSKPGLNKLLKVSSFLCSTITSRITYKKRQDCKRKYLHGRSIQPDNFYTRSDLGFLTSISILWKSDIQFNTGENLEHCIQFLNCNVILSLKNTARIFLLAHFCMCGIAFYQAVLHTIVSPYG